MSRFRCNTCRGEYDDVGADGVLYFHSCPPVTLVAVTDDKDQARELPLRALAGITLVASAEARADAIKADADPSSVYIERARRAAPRKDARDERTLRREGEKGERRILYAEGKGRTEIRSGVVTDEPVDDAP